MNYLAHLHLGGSRPEQLLGSLYGDFVKGPLKGEYHEDIEKAIDLHRRLDGFTDRHPLLKTARNRFSPELMRYSGIVLDVFFDHCLARHWQDYSSTPLPHFTQKVYHLLLDQPQLPGRLEQMAPYMIADDWLSSYRDFTVIRRSLAGISRRLGQPGLLDYFWPQLVKEYDFLTQDFHALYPELQEFARNHPSVQQEART
ncbi:ACP phosphodiesterase [Marinospirillum sp.]|uniref:acyl carrier protein phosphodiesterase n=1 Tax=Marinospirillum sp. TaxID=2183934 RepID=UPI00384B59B8